MHIGKRERVQWTFSGTKWTTTKNGNWNWNWSIQLKINSAGFSNSNSNCVFVEAWIENIDFQLILILFASVLACANGLIRMMELIKMPCMQNFPPNSMVTFCCSVIVAGGSQFVPFSEYALCKSLLILAPGHIDVWESVWVCHWMNEPVHLINSRAMFTRMMCSQSHQTLNCDLIHIVWLLHTRNDNSRRRRLSVCVTRNEQTNGPKTKQSRSHSFVEHSNIYYAECSMINWHFIFRFSIYFSLCSLFALASSISPSFPNSCLCLCLFPFCVLQHWNFCILNALSACLHQCKHLFWCHTFDFHGTRCSSKSHCEIKNSVCKHWAVESVTKYTQFESLAQN